MSGEEPAVRHSPGRSGEEITREMAETAAGAANAMFGRETTLIDLRGLVSYADYFVVTSAETDRQTRRIAEEVIDRMAEKGYRPRSRRVDGESPWISLDYLDVVVHIFTDEARDYYRLESLWRSAPQERWEG
ncbi:Iojap-related protein [Rubrobacter xylanophilus DSM 9941]|uniref:Ribosomal silencing factor RsfS n=1 Tax=Rubrobacter xylanophilus (strain DSM 9941 / JCM 11954 / NBRC 16129 / PRD-1) TaxID=266117 RepID=Q1AVU5_RUBXD|nr:ribosome silencing factor [Rubrobacter xylanophilus]ABG04483.1 Iojap-related protein [Rubrobacter xylanophilus DSM 9941]